VTGGLLILMAVMGPYDKGWPFYATLITLGALPYLTVLRRIAAGKNGDRF
jgi:hypothetical protein